MLEGSSVPDDPTLAARAARIRLLLFDVDGVLTDGQIIINADGSESKRFNVRDGTAIVWAGRQGLLTGVLSGRSSPATAERARQLGMAVVRQDAAIKEDAYERIRLDLGLADEEIAYMGDDVLDLPVLARAGLSAAPADAVDEVRRRVHWVSRAPGGRGAAREFVELVLRAQQRWGGLLAAYTSEATGP
jgi:3-deoxy-D-manno-octulosonate 8-phosphate phosphatase (KDO 8-P phosphatase)